MEDASYQIIKKNIPSEWVIREFNRPDYGIDLVIELFEKTTDENADTLGEFIYVQVKSVLEVVLKEEKIYPVGNVAKGEWREDKSEFIPIDVAKYFSHEAEIPETYGIEPFGFHGKWSKYISR